MIEITIRQNIQIQVQCQEHERKSEIGIWGERTVLVEQVTESISERDRF